MAMKLYSEGSVQNIADAIRAKNGLSSATYKISEMASAINSFPRGLELVSTEQRDSLTTLSRDYSNIASYAFIDCHMLSYVNLPACERVGGSAFYRCSNLSKVVIGTSSCILGAPLTFALTPMSVSSYLGYFGSIYVPSSYLAYYRSATNWSRYSARLVGY